MRKMVRKIKAANNMVFSRLFQSKPQLDAAHKLYVDLVGHARLPGFFRDGAVPDTIDGRFDMVVLHAFLLLRRLSGFGASQTEKDLAQNLFDVMFGDMDRNLREMGVGDLGVGAKIRVMVEAFYGRVAAYEAGLAAGSDTLLMEALARNVYRGASPSPQQLKHLAAYLRRESQALAAYPSESLLEGTVCFGPPPSFGGA